MKPVDLNKIKKTLRFTSYPVNLVLEAIAFCNLRCLNCPYPFMKREKGRMSIKLYKKIIDEIASNNPKNTNIWFAFMGEPLMLGRDLFGKIKYAKEKGIENTYLNTNAILLNKEMVNLAIKSGLDKIIISVDAYNEKTYNKIRRGGNFALLKENIINLLTKIKKNKLTKPEVMVQFIVMDENRGEEEKFKEFWLKQGACVKIRRRLSWGGSIEAKDLLIPQEKRDMPCPWLMRQMVILWDGRVAQCDGDYEGKFNAGNINKQSIYEVWNGELLKRRKRHLNNDFNFEPCNQCNDWQVGLSEFYKPDNIKMLRKNYEK